MPRRLYVGDLHGCADELQDLLDRFGFVAGSDRLFSVGDVMGKGPNALEALRLLNKLGAVITLGNHDAHCLKGATLPEAQRTERHKTYLASLGEEQNFWLKEMTAWPLYHEEKDVLMVHAGLQPGLTHPSQMPRKVLITIRTWDGKGEDLENENNPPWFELVSFPKTVVFGHWARRGLVDLPLFKGLDTGCVYGKMLTGWCPEDGKFYQAPARKAYVPIQAD